MSVVIETTIGDITVDLYTEERPRTCLNFLKLCKMKHYNLNLIFSVERNFIAQTGDPLGNGRGGSSIYQKMYGQQARYYEGEKLPLMKHTDLGSLSMVSCGSHQFGSQFFITLGEQLDSLDGDHLIFGRVVEGMEVINKLNQTLTDDKNRPFQDIRITHTVILHDPFPDPETLNFPNESPKPTRDILDSDHIAADEVIDDTEGKTMEEIREAIAEKEAQARATILEMVGDLPDSEMAPPENVLFVCKLNPVTTSEDLEIIFGRFGKIKNCDVIRDQLTGNSLQYAFIEFGSQKECEDAYFKMDNVLIDERRIHVDFSQSVSKMRWRGKGRGVEHLDNNGRNVDNKHRQFNEKGKFSQNRSKNGRGYGHSVDIRQKQQESSHHRDKHGNAYNERRNEQFSGSGQRKKDEGRRGDNEDRGRRGDDEDRGRRGDNEDRRRSDNEDRGRRGDNEDRGRRGDNEDRGRRGDNEDRGRRGDNEDRGRRGDNEDSGRRGDNEDRRKGGDKEESRVAVDNGNDISKTSDNNRHEINSTFQNEGRKRKSSGEIPNDEESRRKLLKTLRKELKQQVSEESPSSEEKRKKKKKKKDKKKKKTHSANSFPSKKRKKCVKQNSSDSD